MALTFQSSDPASAAVDVPLNAYFKLLFNTQVGAAYISDLNVGTYFQLFRAADSVKVGVRAGLEAGNNLAVYLLPMQVLDPSSKYLLIVVGGTHGVKNLANETLASNAVIQFTTGVAPNNQLLIDITDSVVTFPSPTAEPTPPVTADTDVSFRDVNNLLEGESGIPDFYYEDGSQLAQLYMEFSNPANGAVGVKDLAQFLSYWNEDIRSRYADQSSIMKTQLPYDPDVFGLNQDRSIAMGSPALQSNLLSFALGETGVLNDGTWKTTNFEYILKVPQASLSFATDGKVRNAETVVRFCGPLSPMFATPDMVKTLMSSVLDISDIDYITDYDLYKKIHCVSYELVQKLSYKLDYNSPQMFWVSRYVSCRTAYDLLTGPFDFLKIVTQRSVLGQSVSYTTRNRPDGEIGGLLSCIHLAEKRLNLPWSVVAGDIGVKSVRSMYYPGHKRGNLVRGYGDLAHRDPRTWVPDREDSFYSDPRGFVVVWDDPFYG